MALLKMSSIFVVDLKKHSISFDELDVLSKKLVKLALKENFGIFFDSYDYGAGLIESAKMKNFFLLSDSFLYKNCDFLDTSFFDVSRKDFKKKFMKKYKFISKILEELKKAKVAIVDIYISSDGSVETISDFEKEHVREKDLLEKMFIGIFEHANEYAYGFPTIRYRVEFT